MFLSCCVAQRSVFIVKVCACFIRCANFSVFYFTTNLVTMESKQPTKLGTKTDLDIVKEKITAKEVEIARKDEEIKAAKQANGM